MKRPIALLVGALVATGLAVTPASPAVAGWTTISGDEWSITVTAPDTSWFALFQMDFAACKEYSFSVRVTAGDETDWSISAEVRPAGGMTAIEAFEGLHGSGPGEFLMPGIQLCEHFQSPNTPVDGRFEVTGVASVPSSTTPTRPFATEFVIAPMISQMSGVRHEIKDGASVFAVGVVQLSSDGFRRPVTGGKVIVDRLVGIEWVRTGEAATSSSGVFSVSCEGVLPTGSYLRLTYTGDLSVAPSQQSPVSVPPPMQIPMPITLPPPPSSAVTTPALPIPTVKIKAVSGRSKLKVDVNPNRGSKFYVFQVQRKNADGSWKPVKSYETRGAKETRTLNLRKGTYRVWVRPGYGFAEAYSPNEVTLKR